MGKVSGFVRTGNGLLWCGVRTWLRAWLVCPEHWLFRRDEHDAGVKSLLIRAIGKSMHGLLWTDAQKEAFARLSRGAYVVTCAHQPHWLGGPLFLLHKLLFLIQISRVLQGRMGKPVIPLFWIHEDDHDWRELAHLPDLKTRFFPSDRWANQPFGWYSAGRLLEVYRDELRTILDGSTVLGREFLALWEEGTVTEAFLRFWQRLLGRFGLLFVRAEFCRARSILVRLFVEHVLSERDRRVMLGRWEETRAKGFTPLLRDVFPWMFVLVDGRRERIIRSGDRDFVVGSYRVSASELVHKVEEGEWVPSPAAGLRPVWQEAVCRSLCFVGGPSEIAYWLEMSPLMGRYRVGLPGLCLRDIFLFLDEGQWQWLNRQIVLPEVRWLSHLKALIREEVHAIPDTAQAQFLRGLVHRMGRLIARTERQIVRAYVRRLGLPTTRMHWLWWDRRQSLVRWLARFASWEEPIDLMHKILDKGVEAMRVSFSLPGMQIYAW